MRAISERFRDKELIIKRYINSPSSLFTFLLLKFNDTFLVQNGNGQRYVSRSSCMKVRSVVSSEVVNTQTDTDKQTD